MVFRFLFTLLVLGSLLHAITFRQISQMPKGPEKDYYIWRFISQPSTTPKEAMEVIRQASNINKTLTNAYRAKTGQMPRLHSRGGVPAPPPPSQNDNKAKRYFKTGINAVDRGDLQHALHHFGWANKLASSQLVKDQSAFWLYLLTHDKMYLKQLLKSNDPNLYTLVAQDLVGGKYPQTITQKFPKRTVSHFNIKNPIDWAHLKRRLFSPKTNLEKLAKEYESEYTQGPYTYIKAYASKYREHYFPIPYQDVLRYKTIDRQALIYAIARQESRFVPASVSRSFALGMMQIMPFLVKDISKKKGDNIDLDMMFDPYKAIEYADFHLDYLTSYLYHPLFVAYAYNGGIGFTRRLIERKDYFRQGPYEPYLSIEKLNNVEAREYGKKVLVNYVIYRNKLGKPTRLLPLLKQLTYPAQTDRFRR